MANPARTGHLSVAPRTAPCAIRGHWTKRGIYPVSALQNGDVVRWAWLGDADLPVGLRHVSLAVRHLKEHGLTVGGPWFTDLGMQYAAIGEPSENQLVVVYQWRSFLLPIGGIRVGVYQSPTATERHWDKGIAVMSAIQAAIEGSEPDLSGLTPP